MEKRGRNDPCPCGSGQKYKKCCLRRDEAREAAARPAISPPPARTHADDHACDECGDPAHARHEAWIDADPARPARETVSPYGKAHEAADAVNLRRMRRREREARKLQDPSHVAAMTTDAIQRQLRELGIDGSREAFLPLVEGRRSAWEVSEEWLGQLVLPRSAQVFAGLAAHQLWRRFCPERPSIEAFEDELQEGYGLDAEGDVVGACQAWAKAWVMLRAWLRPEHRTCASADSVARSREALYHWTQDYGMACVPAAVGEPAWAARGVEYHEQILEQFPDEDPRYLIDMRADLAELLERAGEKERAERTARDLIRDHPGSGAGYCRLAELLEWRGDRAQALAFLKDARERMEDEPADWSLDERIEHLEAPPESEAAGGESGDGPICDRPGCFDPPRPGSRFCDAECEYAMSVVERRELR